MSLKDSLPLLRPEEDGPGLPPWIVTEFKSPTEAVSAALDAPVSLDLKISPVRAKASDVSRLKAEKFGELLRKGVKPSEAAHQLHTTVKQLMSKEQTKKVITELIEGYTYDATVRRMLQRALVNKGVLDNSVEGGDPDKLVEYLKMMGKDSEVGIEGPPQVSVNVGIDPNLKALLDRTEDLPGLPAPVEGEFEEVKDEEKQ